jgi:monovalent cation/hydrogen antiporter
MNWSTIQFLLESSVFLLIGLQVRWILADVQRSDLTFSQIATFCTAILVAVIVLRPIWIVPGRALLAARKASDDEALLPWTCIAIISWAGMRGVVTLAAVFVLPESTPHREVLVLAAMVVTAGTLLIQGLTLPWVARRLGVRGPDPREDALQMASVLQQAVAKGIEELDRVRKPNDEQEVIVALRNRAQMRANVVWERLGRPGAESETPSEQYARLRLAMLAAERQEVLRVRDEASIDHEVLSEVMGALDVEESTIDRIEEGVRELRQQDLVTPARRAGACADLAEAPLAAVPLTPEGCPDCVREGTRTVHLRLCLMCGNVGCCDSSVGRHADRHFQTTGHPVMRSFEPGEAWRWCYTHQLLG